MLGRVGRGGDQRAGQLAQGLYQRVTADAHGNAGMLTADPRWYPAKMWYQPGIGPGPAGFQQLPLFRCQPFQQPGQLLALGRNQNQAFVHWPLFDVENALYCLLIPRVATQSPDCKQRPVHKGLILVTAESKQLAWLLE